MATLNLWLLAVVAGWSPGDTGRQPTPTTNMADVLRRGGYQPHPLRRFRGQVVLDTTYAGKPLALLVDTGAASSSLDLGTAPAKYGVKVFGRGAHAAVANGGSAEAASGCVPGLKFGRIECPPVPWFLTDLSAALEFSRRNDNLGGDGLLGMDLLDYFSAWVDAGSGTLWLLDPIPLAGEIQGEWRSTSVRHRDGPFGADYDTSYTLTIDGINARYTINGVAHDWKVWLSLRHTPRWLTLYSPEGRRHLGIYKVQGDELTFAAPLLGVDDNTKRPLTFDPQTNGAIVVTYKRVRPAKK